MTNKSLKEQKSLGRETISPVNDKKMIPKTAKYRNESEQLNFKSPYTTHMVVLPSLKE